MAVRKLEYTVSANGVSPAAIRPGGVQGEHRATEVVFNLESKLFSELQTIVENGERLIYRVDGYNGEGGVAKSDTNDLVQSISYLLEEWLTRYGGIIKLVLVISLIKEGQTEMELYSFPVMVRLKNLPDGKTVDGVNYESMSTLAQVAKDSADTAVMAAEDAVEAQIKTEEAKRSLEEGTEWIFDGGDSASSVKVEFVIDDEVSDVSNNAIANKAIKGYTDAKLADMSAVISQKNEETIAKLADMSTVISQKNDETIQYIDDKTIDYIVEQGTNGNWTYCKRNSGIAECWFYGYVEFPTETVSTGIDGLYVVSVTIDLPFEFQSNPLSICDTVWYATNWIQSGATTTSVTIRKFANNNGINAKTNSISIYINGRWK